MLSAFPCLVCSDDISPYNPGQPDAFDTQIQRDGRTLRSFHYSRNDDARRDSFGRRAETAASEAAALRQKQTEKDLNESIAKFQKSLQLFKAASLNGRAADASLQIGEIYFILSRYSKAVSFYRQAIHLARKTPDVLCVALSHLARTYATTGQESEAGNFSRQALNQCSSLADPKLRAEALEARGQVLWNSGKSLESAEVFRQSQELFEEAQDKNGQARALLMEAYANFQTDRVKALQFSREALRLWLWTGDRRGVAEVYSQLGIFAATTDEFETARCNYEKSLPVFHKIGDKDNETIALNGIGYGSREIGDIDVSLENYTQARRIFASLHDRLGAVVAITGMARAFTALHQYGPVLSLYRTKLRLAQQSRNTVLEASALADIGDAYELQHQYVNARKFYERSLAAYRSAKRDYGVGDMLIRLARLYVRQGENSKAIALLRTARELKEKTHQVEDIALINFELASIYRQLDRLQDARATLEKTIEIIESQRLEIANFDSRAAYFSSVHKYYALYIQILMLLDQQAPGKGFSQLAFEASEKSKVRALLDLLNASKEDSPCDELLQRQLAPDSSEMSADIKDAAGSAPVLRLKEIQAAIGSDDAVLEYVLGDQESYMWLVDADQIVSYRLPSVGKIEKLVHDFRNALTAREPRPAENSLDEYQKRIQRADAAYPTLARHFSQLLLGPVRLKGIKRLLIVPDGVLQYIPFSALPLPEADKHNAVLISEHEVVMLPSASALSTLRTAAGKRMPPTRIGVVFADPVVEENDRRVGRARSVGKRKPPTQPPSLKIALRDAQEPSQIARLIGSRAEAEIIRRVLGEQNVRLALDFSASRDAVLHGALEGYRFIHFATHGIIDARHPEMSGLILSLVNERGKPQDGYLRLGDIYKLNLSADLVVLSACNSAMGKDLESEGVIGLPRGFLYAGSRSVMASLWKVDDEAAADFMKGFYERIHGGASPSSALRGAQLEMLQAKRWSAPFYWATFVLQGDYK